MRYLSRFGIVQIVLLLWFCYAQSTSLEHPDIGYVEGKILELTPTGATVQLKDNSIIQANLGISDTDSNTSSFKAGQRVELYYSPSTNSNRSYVVVDWIRRPVLGWLAALFLLSVLAIAHLRGLRAFLATLCSLVIIIMFMLPKILEGWNPTLVSLLGIGGMLMLAIYFVHGLNWSTTAALIGTYTTVVVTLLLGRVFGEWAYLTGLGSEEAMMLSFSAGLLDLKGLLMAGLLISAIGALTDITIVQASVIRELSFLNPQFGIWNLYRQGMNVGYDHVGSLVNTLVLAFTGTALPLLIILRLQEFNPQRTLNLEMVATEIIHTLVGSIGLILAVPFTTLVASVLFHGNRLRVNLNELGKGH
jgi:uncharacterized membrane protein